MIILSHDFFLLVMGSFVERTHYLCFNIMYRSIMFKKVDVVYCTVYYYQGFSELFCSCYQMVSFYFMLRLFLLQFSVFVIPLIVNVFPLVLVCDPYLYSLNRYMTIQKRYTIAAFIYVIHEHVSLKFAS